MFVNNVGGNRLDHVRLKLKLGQHHKRNTEFLREYLLDSFFFNHTHVDQDVA